MISVFLPYKNKIFQGCILPFSKSENPLKPYCSHINCNYGSKGKQEKLQKSTDAWGGEKEHQSQCVLLGMQLSTPRGVRKLDLGDNEWNPRVKEDHGGSAFLHRTCIRKKFTTGLCRVTWLESAWPASMKSHYFCSYLWHKLHSYYWNTFYWGKQHLFCF